MKIIAVSGHEVYDSSGLPTIMCAITLEDGHTVFGKSAGGTSATTKSARDKHDGEKRLWGKGVRHSIELIQEVIAPILLDKEPSAAELDLAIIQLDNTSDCSYLGANTMLATSMALYRAQAYVHQIPLYELIGYIYGAKSITLPFPFFTIFNNNTNTKHNLLFHEIMVVPVASSCFRDAVELGTILYQEISNRLKKSQGSTTRSQSPEMDLNGLTDMQALELLTEVLEQITATDEQQCVIAINADATHLYDAATKRYRWHNGTLSSEQMVGLYEQLIKDFPIYSIEDGLSENDPAGWRLLASKIGQQIQLVGNTLCASQAAYIEQAATQELISSVIIKPYEIGTITQTLQTIQLCQEMELNTIVASRLQETEDDFIADLSVGVSAGQVKIGDLSHTQNLSKYNRLLYIEDTLITQDIDISITQ